LLTHALFKALLFICAGGVIHSIGDPQDIHFIGSLSIYIPFTSSSLIVSNFALCGMPFLARFYSRDFILEMFSMRYVKPERPAHAIMGGRGKCRYSSTHS
jgi:NADH:ubiquinone oxidoreductase subunit 5 (subunit L)/multisubunit Na+/H+ antiporter MnhA subunit